MTDKYMKAIARHELAKQSVDSLTAQIGESIRSCPLDMKAHDPNIPDQERQKLWDDGAIGSSKTKTHLWHAFQVRELASHGWYYLPLCEDGVLDALSEGSEYECEHCHRAYELIIERKEARRELGKARLAIRALGKQAIKELEND